MGRMNRSYVKDLMIITMLLHLLFRGGSDLGREWYEDGKLGNKMNSFKDFISVADYLIENKVTTPEYLSAIGTSAGGLLVGKLLYIFVFKGIRLY